MDVRPPVLVRTEPDTFATITDLDTPVRFHFDERISEQVSGGQLDDAVTVSPSTGEVRVSHGRSSLTVEVEGGFRPGLLYRVTLQPVVSDMFGNQLRDPFELVFSTGGTAPPTAVAGQAWDRTTGQPVRDALVQAVTPDSVTYVSRADQEGIFALRYLPEGSYRLTAFEDVDRDGVLDERETQGSVDARIAEGDTLLVDVPVLPSDTTPARLLTASALDSVTVVLEHDDYLDFESQTDEITVRIDGPEGPGPAITRVFHERAYAEFVESMVDSLLRLDSLDEAARAAAAPPAPSADSVAAADTTVADTVLADSATQAVPRPDVATASQGTPSRPAPPVLPGVRARTQGRGPERPLPGRRLVAVLASALAVDVEYDVTVGGVVNINGVPGGGGETTLRRPAPAPEPEPEAPGGDAVPQDTVPAPDSIPPGATPDSIPGAGL